MFEHKLNVFQSLIKANTICFINHLLAPWLENNNRVSKFTSSDCPPSSGKSLRLKIADPKNPSNIRCHYMNEKVTPPEIKVAYFHSHIMGTAH